MPIERLWLIFQILCGLVQLHSIPQMAHGDLKPDNILVTSFDWLLICDINPLKPVQVLDTDLKTYNLYFGDLDNNNRCYLAPERWVTPPNQIDENAVLEQSMDVFSAGCIIAEILSDGEPLFDLPKLQQYRHSGKFKPEVVLANRISDPQLVKLIMEMINLDPSKRPTASECLDRWNATVFPETFHTVFFQICSQCFCLQHLYADNRLSLVRYYSDAIFYKCFNIKDGARLLNFTIPLDDQTFRLLQLDNLQERNKHLLPSQFKFCNRNMMTTGQEWDDLNWEKLTDVQKQLNKDSALIIINWIGSQISGCFNQLDKLTALEMIQKLAKYLSFDVRLNRILPYISQAFGFDQHPDQGVTVSRSQVRVKALETLLSLFYDVLESNEKVIIQPNEYKVFQNYILPLVKKLMDTTKTTDTGQGVSSRGDDTVRHAIANNLALLTKVGIRCIEIAQASSLQLREEIKQRKGQKVHKEQDAVSDTVDASFFTQQRTLSMYDQLLNETKHRNKRSTVHSIKKRPTISKEIRSQIMETIEEEKEIEITTQDIQAPNYDTEVDYVTNEIIQVIQSFSGENQDANSLIAMLANLSELSQFFDVDKGDDLFMQCINMVNNPNPRVKIQALKTLMSLGARLGQKKVENKILPVVDHILINVLDDDGVVIQTLKLCNLLTTVRLVKQDKCEEILQLILPLTLHPNRQIRESVAKYVFTLATLGHNQNEEDHSKEAKINYNKGPLFTQVEFYAKIRPMLMKYLTENAHGRRDITQIKSLQDLKSRLRPPLPLKLFLKCLKDPLELTREHNSDEKFALEALIKMINCKFKQKTRQSQDNRKAAQFSLQTRPRNKYYRLIKAASLAVMMKLDLFDSFLMLQPHHERHYKLLKIKASTTKNLIFEPTKLVSHEAREQLNFGLNKFLEEVKKIDHHDHQMTPEMINIVTALDHHNDQAQIKYFTSQNQLTENKGIYKSLRVDQQLKLSALGAQPSVLPHFAGVDHDEIQAIKVNDDLRRKGKPLPATQHKFQGTLVTTLYEHKNPVNTVSVADDNNFFFTGSREDRKVLVWKVANIEQDITSRPIHSIQTDSLINQVSSLHNTHAIAVAGSQGVHIYDLSRTLAESTSTEYSAVSPNCLSNIALSDANDEVNAIINVILPFANKQHIFCCATQKGCLLLHDIRAQRNLLYEEQSFSPARGAVSCMAMGYEPYQVTVGTLGGYVMVYDIRYNLTSALYRHHMNYPVLALATCKVGGMVPQTLVSSGGPVFEMSQLNLENGVVESLFRCLESKNGAELKRSDLLTVPEFYRETTFRDGYVGTLRRESCFRQFSRSMMSVRNNEQFTKLMNQASLCIKNIDQQFMEASSQRYKLIHDAYLSPNACRTILIPRQSNSMLFDGTTANYAITAGNDKKIRYWAFNNAKSQNMIINSPNDDEVQYTAEKVTSSTILVMERSVSHKEFPILTHEKLKEQGPSTILQQLKDQMGTTNQYVQIAGQHHLIKYSGNSSYHNIVAEIVQARQNQQVPKESPVDPAGRPQQPPAESERILARLQTEKIDGQGTIIINNLNGLSVGQHMNDLSIFANGACESGPKQPVSSLNAELLKEKIIRSSDIVSHTDAILDIAQIEYRSQTNVVPLLVSVSRDCTVKIWR